MARGRKPIEVSKEGLQKAIAELEASQTFPNRSALWLAVENSEFAKSCQPRPLKGQVAMLKAEEFNLEIKTPKGLRGKTKGSGPVVGGGRKKKVFSFENVEKVLKAIPTRSTEPSDSSCVTRETLAKTIEKFRSGSLKAAVKLMCLSCSNWSKKEVRVCNIQSCPLHLFRPYKQEKKTLVSLEVVSNAEVAGTEVIQSN